MLHYVTITSQGQITIPAAVRRKLSLKKNQRAVLELENDQILITPEKDILELEGIFKTNKKIPFKKVREEFGNYLASRHLGNKY